MLGHRLTLLHPLGISDQLRRLYCLFLLSETNSPERAVNLRVGVLPGEVFAPTESSPRQGSRGCGTRCISCASEVLSELGAGSSQRIPVRVVEDTFLVEVAHGLVGQL